MSIVRETPKDELGRKQSIIDRINSAGLEELIDWSLETYKSPENKKKMESTDPLKFIIYIGRTVYGDLLHFTQPEFFEEADKSLAAQLREKLFVHYVLEDDTPFNLNVGVDLGTALEATLFGMKYVYSGSADPTYENTPLLSELEDYKKLTYPDFYKSGWMPEAHRLYDELQKISKGRLDVYFPGWARGPWSMITILRGFNNSFMDYADDPEELADFSMFLADSRIQFEKDRLAFLGLDPAEKEYRWTYCSYRLNHNSDVFEDEVDGNLFSLSLFKDIIAPATQKVADFYGGSISYYHSCGSLIPFTEEVTKFDVKNYMHISPLTFPGYEKFNQLLDKDCIAQISLKPTDVLSVTDENQIAKLLTEKMSRTGGRRAEICADALFAGGWDLVENTLRWRNVFRKLRSEM